MKDFMKGFSRSVCAVVFTFGAALSWKYLLELLDE